MFHVLIRFWVIQRRCWPLLCKPRWRPFVPAPPVFGASSSWTPSRPSPTSAPSTSGEDCGTSTTSTYSQVLLPSANRLQRQRRNTTGLFIAEICPLFVIIRITQITKFGAICWPTPPASSSWSSATAPTRSSSAASTWTPRNPEPTPPYCLTTTFDILFWYRHFFNFEITAQIWIWKNSIWNVKLTEETESFGGIGRGSGSGRRAGGRAEASAGRTRRWKRLASRWGRDDDRRFSGWGRSPVESFQ